MSIRLSVLVFVLAALPLVVEAQAQLPPDIHPVTLSRLPPVTPADLDEEGRRLLAERENFTPGPGPTHVTVYSPRDRDLGIPTGENSPIGARYFQLAVLIAAREIDQQYEWSAHEPAGLRQGLEQSVIDVVKFDRDVAGLSAKDRTLITFGRTLLREHGVSSELWQEMVSHFGRQGTVDVMSIMGDYLRVGIMLNAVDQHLPPSREALLPSLDRTGHAGAADEPDFSGVWQAYASVSQTRPGQAAALTEQGARMVEAYFAQYGDDYVEPGAYCVPPGMPSTMTSMVSYPIEIIHSPNRLTMLAELDMQVRRVYMDGRDFPDDYPTSRMGYSVGHWEDETLVIETGLLSEYLMRSWPRTENTEIVERVYRANRDELDVERNGFPEESESNDLLVFELTVTDATLYKEPQRITMYYQRIPQDEFLEYDCTAGLWDAALRGEGE